MIEEQKNACCVGGNRWPLIASVALNVFLIGVISGPFLMPAPMDGPPPFAAGMPGPREHGFMIGALMRQLPAEEGAKLRAIFDDERKNAGQRHQIMRETMKKMADVMRMEKPDIESMRKIMGEVNGAGQAMHEGISRAMERVATELSFESRQVIADMMEKERGPRGSKPPMMDKGALPPDQP